MFFWYSLFVGGSLFWTGGGETTGGSHLTPSRLIIKPHDPGAPSCTREVSKHDTFCVSLGTPQLLVLLDCQAVDEVALWELQDFPSCCNVMVLIWALVIV